MSDSFVVDIAALRSRTEPDSFFGTAAVTAKGRERVLRILDAAKDALISNGYSGLTLRLVAERAKVAHGNVQYYFPTKEKLVESLVMAIEAALRQDLRKALAEGSQEPVEQLRSYVRYNIHANQTESIAVLFSELFAMAHRVDFIRDQMLRMYAEYRRHFEELISAANPRLSQFTCKIRAALVISLIDGLTIFTGGKNAQDPLLVRHLGEEAERTILRLVQGAE